MAQADLSSPAAIAIRGVALEAVETTPVGRPPLFSPAALAKELVFCWSRFAEEHVAESAGVHGSASWLEALTVVTYGSLLTLRVETVRSSVFKRSSTNH